MAKRSSDRVEIPSGEDPEANVGDYVDAQGAETLGESISEQLDGSGGDSGSGGSETNSSGQDNGFEQQQRQYYDPAEYILDEAGNPTYSPTGRIRKYRRRGDGGSAGPQSGTRPAGKKVPVKYTQEDIDTNAAIIYGAHMVVAKVGNVPEMELNTSEAELLSNAVTPLLVDNGIQPPKWMKDFINITSAFSYVYGPRFQMIGERMKEEKAAKQREQQRRQHQQIVPVGTGGPNFQSRANPDAGPIDIILEGGQVH
jgi:hypothetical protein